MDSEKVSCCSWLASLFKRQHNQALRQLHPTELELARESNSEEALGLNQRHDFTMHNRVSEASMAMEAKVSKYCALHKQLTSVPPPTTCGVGTETDEHRESEARLRDNGPPGFSTEGPEIKLGSFMREVRVPGTTIERESTELLADMHRKMPERPSTVEAADQGLAFRMLDRKLPTKVPDLQLPTPITPLPMQTQPLEQPPQDPCIHKIVVVTPEIEYPSKPLACRELPTQTPDLLSTKATDMLTTKATECFAMMLRDLSPIPLNSSRIDLPSYKSFSSEPALKSEDALMNSFEYDQAAYLFNHSSERVSLLAIRDQLELAFEDEGQKPSLNLKFRQLPIDPYEFEVRPEKFDFKATPDPFQLCSDINPHLIKGRLRLKPITPGQFAKRIPLPSYPKPDNGGNVLDELKKELNEEGKLNEGNAGSSSNHDEGSPAPASLAM